MTSHVDESPLCRCHYFEDIHRRFALVVVVVVGAIFIVIVLVVAAVVVNVVFVAVAVDAVEGVVTVAANDIQTTLVLSLPLMFTSLSLLLLL